MIWRIALRNLWKNRRRSLTTVIALGIGGLAMLLFGGFVAAVYYGVQTTMIQEQGHIHVYAKGYVAFGAVEPENYTINQYPAVIDALLQDRDLRERIAVITPQIQLSGIAGVVATDNSKIFIGRGVVGADADHMRRWDGWNLGQFSPPTGLDGQPEDAIIVGIGMARMLGLCAALSLPDCTDPPRKISSPRLIASPDAPPLPDALAFTAEKQQNTKTEINLLAATSTGLPNIETAFVHEARGQSLRTLDDAFVMMSFPLARRLLHGDAPKATQVLIQLKNPDDVTLAKERIRHSLEHLSSRDKGQEFEVFTLTEVDPTFSKILRMFSFIFGFVAFFLGIVIAVTIANTINLTVMERINEIGTIRALGFRQSFITRLFLAESTLLGIFGILLAVILTFATMLIINATGIQWTPPSSATPLTIRLLVFENPLLLGAVSGFIVLLAVLAAVLPTRRASRMNIVTALHHA